MPQAFGGRHALRSDRRRLRSSAEAGRRRLELAALVEDLDAALGFFERAWQKRESWTPRS